MRISNQPCKIATIKQTNKQTIANGLFVQEEKKYGEQMGIRAHLSLTALIKQRTFNGVCAIPAHNIQSVIL